MKNEKIFVPPFKIQGIKTKLLPLIKSAITIENDMTWIEPFMGSAVVGLNIAAQKAVFADLNPHIINFYNSLKLRKITAKMVREFLQDEGAILAEKGEEHYYHIRTRFNTNHNPLDFLFLNRSCFNGMIRFNKTNNFNVPYCHKSQRFSKAYITKIVNQVAHFEQKILQNDWQFLCQSFEKTIAMASENDFIYCDPPYIGRHVDYFDSWDEQQEQKLKNSLFGTTAKFMLSTWDKNKYRSNPYIKLFWNDCSKINHEHFYFVGAQEKNRNSMTEALLTNYTVSNAKIPKSSNYEQINFEFDELKYLVDNGFK